MNDAIQAFLEEGIAIPPSKPEFVTEDHILARKMAVAALRDEPESLRACRVMMNPEKTMVCAIALIAKKLGMELRGAEFYLTTHSAVMFAGTAMGLDMTGGGRSDMSPGEALLNEVVLRNDAIREGCEMKPAFTWREIGDFLETALKGIEHG
jgi:hypothetical protein